MSDSVDLVKPAQHLFEHQLRLPVGIDGFLQQGLVNGHPVGCAEGGAGRGEDDFFYTGLHHGFQKVEAAGDIVAEVFDRVGHGLAYEGVGGKVHDGLRLGCCEGVGDGGDVHEVALGKGSPRVDRLAVALGEVVENRDGVACVEQFLHANAANISRAACDKDVHKLESYHPIFQHRV